MIEVKDTRKLGRGLFATRNIRKGEVVERSPVIVLESSLVPVKSSLLNVYMFEWQRNTSSLALGLGSLFNHSAKRANITYNPVYQRKEIIFVATRDIKRGHQLFINYGYDPKYGLQVTKRNKIDALEDELHRLKSEDKRKYLVGSKESHDQGGWAEEDTKAYLLRDNGAMGSSK